MCHGKYISVLITFHTQRLLFTRLLLIKPPYYALMGLAPFGKLIYVELIKKNLIQINSDESYWLDTSYFCYLDDLVATNRKFENLFGRPARQAEAAMEEFYIDVAASIQAVLNEAVLNSVKRIKTDTNCENLCLAGGGALGCALALYFLKCRNKRPPDSGDQMHGAYLGPSYSDTQIEVALSKHHLKFSKFNDDQILDLTVQLLLKNQIIGWFQGRIAYGPRALGARPILGNPFDPRIKTTMNLKIKFRESFRPFAPIVNLENYTQYFSLRLQSEYMLFISKVKNQKLMPSITHVDGTARFQKLSGHPVLINTLFNVRSEPIVCSPEDSIYCILNTDIDALVIENYIVTKVDNPGVKRNDRWHEQFKLD